MYKFLIRPVLFAMKPETAHKCIFRILTLSRYIPFASSIHRALASVNHTALERKVFGLTFKNPVGLAAGLDKNATAYNELSDFGFGFVEIGTVTPKPQPGNPKPRLFRMVQDLALINRMGFNNLGVLNAVQNLKKHKHRVLIGGNIGKNTLTANEEAINDYVFCFNELFDSVDYFVVNVSCPNIKDLHKLQDKDSLVSILEKLQSINNSKPAPKPILLKIAPDLNNQQLDEVIEIAGLTKIAGIVATNTTTSREGLCKPVAEIESIGNGGMSGKTLTNRSTEVIRYLSSGLGKNFPIIGVGGIMTPQDAIDKINAGAALIQIYTGFIYEGPCLVKRINKAILKG